jgi:hypothetical protein
MDAEETRAYVEHRLSTVGWKGDPSFSAAAFAAIFGNTGGIPRKVNTLCDRLLLMGFLEEMHAFDEADVNTVIADIAQEFELPTTPADIIQAADAAHPAATAAFAPQAGQSAAPAPAAAIDTNPLMDERLMRLEKSVVSVLNILKKLVATPAGANTPLNHNNE